MRLGNFLASPEFESTYGSNLNDSDFVDALYDNVLEDLRTILNVITIRIGLVDQKTILYGWIELLH